MTPRAFCTGGDHRPPPWGGSCACGLVTRVPKRTAAQTAAPLVPPEVRDLIARCLYEGPEDPLERDASDEQRLSGALRLRADRMLLALAAAGLVITADPALSQAA